MRLDNYLKVSRLIKRRTVANEACDAGRVFVNDKPAKASVNVKPGDIIEIQFGNKNTKVYHYAGCSYLPYAKNRVTFATEKEAKAAGYRLHSGCHN